MNITFKSILLSLVLIATFYTSNAENSNIDNINYSWEENPKFDVPVTEEDYSEVIIKDKNVIEFIIESGRFLQYDLNHLVTYISSESGVEDNNKIYLSTYDSETVIFQKARVINSAGQVIEFDKKDIKEGVDEQSGYGFQYFALDGLDIGSFVETITLTKRPAKYNGHKKTLQTSVPKLNMDFELICPDNLLFTFLSTNGLEEVKLDTTLNDKNYYRLNKDNMEIHEFEPISYGASNLQSVVYKLDENTASGATNMTTYTSVARNYFSYMYDDFPKSDVKAINSLIKQVGIKNDMSSAQKIERLESHLKENFAVLPYVLPEYQSISALLENKASDENTFVKLYANAFKIMDIQHEIVLTSDRTSNKFNEDFEANNFLQTAFFYFPKLDQYLSPEADYLRLGFVPWELTETYGLFVRPLKTKAGELGAGKIRFIDALDETKSAYNHYITVDMTEDPFEPIIDFDVQLSGYMSSFLQTAYEFLSDDEKEKTDESLIDMVAPGSDEAEIKVVNGEAALFGKKPLSLQVKTTSLNFTEKAGNKVLFKVGELIGEQTELYNEEPRKALIENDYNRTFDREIIVKLPEDYEVSNLDKLNFDNSMPDETAVFKSSYTLEDNVLTITIHEYYSRINFSVDEFEDYKKVINAAADFNKVILYLEEN